MALALCAAALMPAAAWAAPPGSGPKKTKRPSAGAPKAKAMVPSAASEGARDLSALPKTFKPFMTGQPYGQHWRELIPTDPPPKDRTGLGKAKTHPDLQFDEIEMQQQSQFLMETGVEARYGFVSIRGVRVFRYGQLVAVQLVIDRIGKGKKNLGRFREDLTKLSEAWKAPRVALDLERDAVLVKNELAAVKKNGAQVELPIRIELEPSVDRRRNK